MWLVIHDHPRGRTMDRDALHRPGRRNRRASPALLGIFFAIDLVAIVVTWAFGNRFISGVLILLGVAIMAGVVSVSYSERNQGVSKGAAIVGLLAMASVPVLGVLLLLQIRPSTVALSLAAIAAVLVVLLIVVARRPWTRR
jgi:hypothetical protein